MKSKIGVSAIVRCTKCEYECVKLFHEKGDRCSHCDGRLEVLAISK